MGGDHCAVSLERDGIAKLFEYGFLVGFRGETSCVVFNDPTVLGLRTTTPEASDWFGRRSLASVVRLHTRPPLHLYRCDFDWERSVGQGFIHRARRFGFDIVMRRTIVRVPCGAVEAAARWSAIDRLPSFAACESALVREWPL